jgi:hypothetical protein
MKWASHVARVGLNRNISIGFGTGTKYNRSLARGYKYIIKLPLKIYNDFT